MTGDPIPPQPDRRSRTQLDLPAIETSTGSLTFADLLRVIIERRTMLLVGSLLGLVLSLLYVAFFGALYRSEAVLNLRYVSFAEYKRYSPALSDRAAFMDFAARSGQFSAPELDRIARAIGGADALNKWIRPLFTITKADVKEAAETPENANQFAGVTIDIAMNSRDLAQRLVIVCSNYVRDFVIAGKIYDLVLPGLATAVSDLVHKEIDILRSRFDLHRLEQRRSELQGVASRYRSAERESQQRQVISTQDGGERYLSPVTQIIGVEAQIVEANSDLAGLQRDTDRLAVLIAFYKDVRARLAVAKLGEQFAAMNLAFGELQKRGDANADATRDALETIRASVEQLRAYDADYLRLAAPPSSQSQIGSILVWAPIVLATLVAFLLALFIAIALEWWRRNRLVIVGPSA